MIGEMAGSKIITTRVRIKSSPNPLHECIFKALSVVCSTHIFPRASASPQSPDQP